MPTVFNSELYGVINEMSESESFNYESNYLEETLSDLVDNVSEVKEINEDFSYVPESITVLNFDTDNEYLVEMNDLIKYMDTCNINDISYALSNIAEVNNIPSSSLGVLIESDDYFDEMINEAKHASIKNKKKKAKEVHDATKFIKNVFNKGITIKKKKSKKPFKISFDGIAKKKKKGKK